MSKRPITSAQVKTLRNNVKEKPLQELLLNLGVDLMMRSSDLLSMTVGQVVSESGKVKTEVRVKQKSRHSSVIPCKYSPYFIIVLTYFQIGL